jgi:cytochrome c peroxidase
VRLGQALMFDKILSGNRDVSCATCHHPSFASGDGLSLAIGTGGVGTGTDRVPRNDAGFVPRNSPPLFNLGHPEFSALFWDGRVARKADGRFETPAGSQLPSGLTNLLAAQAMIPVTTRLEMRGQPGDVDRFGNPNELAQLDDADFPAIWRALMARLMAIPEYAALFQAAYPEIPADQLGFQHAADAIAAFEIDAFTLTSSTFDRYLAGDDGALGEPAKRGGVLFYGKAKCASCHGGNQFTDQQFHDIGVPQIGPGFGSAAPEDLRRAGVTGRTEDRFRFRTPSLRNVALTGPWMHDGAFTTLRAAVLHYRDVPHSLQSYDAAQLPPLLQGTVLSTDESFARILANLDPVVASPLDLSDGEVDDVLAFLESLTDASDMPAVPLTVPSGLPPGD